MGLGSRLGLGSDGGSSDGERTLRLELEFDGADFRGWQRQAAGRTVQQEVEQALGRLLGAPHGVVGCGRTDAGVHARHMIVSFRTAHSMPASDLERALDALLPEDVGVLRVRDAAPTFHARRDAIWKWYRYQIRVARRKRPLGRRTVWRLGRAPDLEALRAAAAPLVGRHDFKSFANLGSNPGHTVRTVHRLDWTQSGDRLHLDAVGEGFLYKMVRTLVGTMLQAAGAADPAAETASILAQGDRRAAGTPAPAAGLCLMAVAIRGEPAPPQVPMALIPGQSPDNRDQP